MNSIKLEKWQKICLALCGAGFVCSLLLFIPFAQNLILDFGESLVHRPLTRPVWIGRFIKWGIELCVFFFIVAIILTFPKTIEKFIKNCYDYIQKHEKVFSAIALSIFFILNVVCIIYHEHWRDEAQSWLIAKYTSPLGLLKITPNEGHPCLFYLILMPFAKLGFNYDYLSFVTFAFVFFAALIFLKYSTVNLVLKILLLFTPVFMYFPGVIARSYCLIPLELVVISCFYDKRKDMPFLWGLNIALMLQTHIYLAGLCGMLMLQMLFDCFAEKNKKQKLKIFIGGIIATASLALLFIELGVGNSNGSNNFFMVLKHPISSILEKKGVINVLITRWSWINGIFELYLSIGILLFIILKSILNLKKCFWELAIFLGTFATLFAINLVYGGGHMNHRTAIFSIYLFCFYLIKIKAQWKPIKKIKLEFVENIAFCIMLLLSLKNPFYYIFTDIKQPFSSSKAMANYINENCTNNNIIINNDLMMYCAVSAYLEDEKYLTYPSDGTKFEFLHIGTSRVENYDLWDESQSDKPTIYLFADKPCDDTNMELIHFDETEYLMHENYYLYKKKK